MLALAPLLPYRDFIWNRLVGNTVLDELEPPAPDAGPNLSRAGRNTLARAADTLAVVTDTRPCQGDAFLHINWALPWVCLGLAACLRCRGGHAVGALALVLFWLVCLTPPLLARSDPVAARRFLMLTVSHPLFMALGVAALARGASAWLRTAAVAVPALCLLTNAVVQMSGPMWMLFDHRSQAHQVRLMRFALEQRDRYRVAMPLFVVGYPSVPWRMSQAPELEFLCKLYGFELIAPGSPLPGAESDSDDLIWPLPDDLTDAEQGELTMLLGGEPLTLPDDPEVEDSQQWMRVSMQLLQRRRGLQRQTSRSHAGAGGTVLASGPATLDDPLPSGAAELRLTGALYCPGTGEYGFRYSGRTPLELEIGGRTVLALAGPGEARRLLHRGYHQISLSWRPAQDGGPLGKLLEWRPPQATDFRPFSPHDTVPFPITSRFFAAPPSVERPSATTLVVDLEAWNPSPPGTNRVEARSGQAVSLAGAPFGPTLHLRDGVQRPPPFSSPLFPREKLNSREDETCLAQRDFVWLPNGSFILSNPVDRAVMQLDATGKTLRAFVPPCGYTAPGALAADVERNRLFVADAPARRLHLFRLDGTYLGIQPSKPITAMTVLPDGKLAIYSAQLGRIAIRDPGGRVVHQWMSPTSSVFGDLAFDAAKQWLLVLQPDHSIITRYTPGGLLAGPPVRLPPPDRRVCPDSTTNRRYGLTVTRRGRLVVTGRFCVQVMRWQDEEPEPGPPERPAPGSG
jgi:hypothetical protein